MKDEKYIPDFDSMTDEEVEYAFDAFAGCVMDRIREEAVSVSVANPEREADVVCTYAALRRAMRDQSGIKVSYVLHKPFSGTGCVSIEGKSPVFKNTDILMKSIMISDNFEVYPKTNGTVQINFTFHGLTDAAE